MRGKRSLIFKSPTEDHAFYLVKKNVLLVTKYKLFCLSNLELICTMFLLFIIFCVIGCSAD